MISITGRVVGDKAVVARISSIVPSVRQSLTRAMLRITIDLQGYVVKNKLSGQLLNRRTGTLAASMQHKVVSTSEGVVGVVGSRVNAGAPLKYARALEDGFTGTVNVREHLRMMTTAFGKAVKDPHKITVGAHSAHRNIKARHYLSSSLAERRDAYLDQIEKAVGEGANK